MNLCMCTLYYLYFLSSRVIQMTPYFMFLLVLIFIVNRNFKLFRFSILLLLSFVLLPFAVRIFFYHYYYYYYLLITIIIYSLIYLFICSYLLYGLSIYFVVLTCIRYNLLSPLPHKIYYSLYCIPLKIVK